MLKGVGSGVGTVTGNTVTTPTQIMRIRTSTAADGTYTWVFPVPFPNGVLPIIAISTEGSSTLNYQHTITSISNISISIKVTPIVDVTVVGIHVLGIQTTQAAIVHLLAVSST